MRHTAKTFICRISFLCYSQIYPGVFEVMIIAFNGLAPTKDSLKGRKKEHKQRVDCTLTICAKVFIDFLHCL